MRQSQRERNWEALALALGRRCAGRTLLGGEGAEQLVAQLDRHLDSRVSLTHSSELTNRDQANAQPSTSANATDPLRWDTVVLWDALLPPDHPGSQDIVSKAWKLLAADGKLIVVQPNDECLPAAERTGWSQRRLKKLAQSVGRPRLGTDQPYNWLVFEVRKGNSEAPNPSERDRFEVIANICRGDVAELGCGEGHLSKAIADRGLRVHGVDISATKIASARKSYPEIEFQTGDICTVPLAERSYDTAVLAEVLEHVPDAVGDQMLTKAWSLLAPKGRLVVSVPNEDCIPHRNHVRRFTRSSLKETLRNFGSPKLMSDQPFKWLMMYVNRNE